MVINYHEIMPSTQITLYIFKALWNQKLIANKLLIYEIVQELVGERMIHIIMRITEYSHPSEFYIINK